MKTAQPDIWSLVGRRSRSSGGRRGKSDQGFWARLAAEVDPAQFRPRLAVDVELKEFQLRWGNDYAVIANPRDQLYYRLEPAEVEILRLMDGKRTVEEIVVERFQESGDLEFDNVAALVRLLEEGNFLDRRFLDVDRAVRQALHPPTSFVARLKNFAKTLTIEWSGAHSLVRWFYDHGFRWLFGRGAQAVNIAVSLLGFVAFAATVRSHRFTIGGKSAAAEGLILMGLGYLLTFVHEMGHALVLVHNRRRVKSAGFLIYFGTPAFFIDSTDGLFMDRRQRITQALAGPYAEMIVAGIAAIFVWAFPGHGVSHTLYKFVVLNYFVLFINLVPFLELDGYFIFSDLIQVPELRAKSLEFVRHEFVNKLRKRERFSLQEVGLAIYSILGLAFTVLTLVAAFFFWRGFFGDLVSKLYRGGFLGRLILLALTIFVAGPLLRGAVSLGRAGARQARYLWESVRFKLETKWRVEAAELIDGLPIFDELPAEVLDDLAGRVRLKAVPAGSAVVRQGEVADAFYVIRGGTLQVIEEDSETGKERVSRSLGRGDSFGELGLIHAAPRAATVRSRDRAQVFEIDKGTFDRLLADTIHVPEFAPTLQRISELREIPAFAHLEPEQLADLLEYGEWVNIEPKRAIFKQGEPGDAFYAIRSGQVEVIRNRKVIQTLGAGAHFGELALLRKTPRAATIRTRTAVRAYRVGPKGFNRLVRHAFKRGGLPVPRMDRTWQH